MKIISVPKHSFVFHLFVYNNVLKVVRFETIGTVLRLWIVFVAIVLLQLYCYRLKQKELTYESLFDILNGCYEY